MKSIWFKDYLLGGYSQRQINHIPICVERGGICYNGPFSFMRACLAANGMVKNY